MARGRGTIALWERLGQVYPEAEGVEALIASGHVRVDGVIRTNPATKVRPDAAVAVAGPHVLRGEAKLRAALDAFRVTVAGRVALDVGAAAGGFTKVLLASGSRRVYAVDAGHGQLLGSLRQDPRVVNLEAHNLADLAPHLVPDPIDVITIDVSYLSLSAAVPQVRRITVAPDADLIALVKPMFELRLGAPPSAPDLLARALEAACAGIEAAGWRVLGSIRSPVLGARGAVEMLVHAHRDATRDCVG